MAESQRLIALGHDVKELHIGQPDFETPVNIREAAKRALDAGATMYTTNAGILPLREAIAREMQRKSGLTYDPASEIIVTAGAIQALSLATSGILDPGDEVLILEPAWTYNHGCVRLANAIPVPVPMREEDGFQVDPAAVRARITPRTRMLMINSPHNPTGTILDPNTQRELAAIAIEHDLVVISDEIYTRLLYDGASVTSIATLPGMRERTLIVDGFSKTFSMTGWRLGWLAFPEPLYAGIIKVHQLTVTSSSSFSQYGAIEALEGPQDTVHAMLAELDTRRQIVLETVERIRELSLVRPRGAFYAYINVAGLGMDGEEFASWFLENYEVAVIPGSAFGSGQESYIRISYGASTADVAEAMRRLERACDELLSRPASRA